MKRFEVILETSAIRNIDEISGWLAETSAEVSQKWFDEIVAATMSLKSVPKSHPFARENGRYPYELRQLLYGPKRNAYRIVFTVLGSVRRGRAVGCHIFLTVLEKELSNQMK